MNKEKVRYDFLELARSRRSVREYTSEIPSDELIGKVLEAGRWAPSGLNNQPWRFRVIKEADKRQELSTFTKYGAIILRAPVIIAVCMDLADSYNREKDLMAMGACIQNMMLAAASLGLGSCWLGEVLNRKEEVRNYLGLLEDIELIVLLALGFPDQDTAASSRKSLKTLTI